MLCISHLTIYVLLVINAINISHFNSTTTTNSLSSSLRESSLQFEWFANPNATLFIIVVFFRT